MVEIIEYRGYRLQVGPVGKGWRASIYSPGPLLHYRTAPPTLKKVAKTKSLRRQKGLSTAALSHGHSDFLPRSNPDQTAPVKYLRCDPDQTRYAFTF
jgi:hypothetical protein